MNEMQPNGNGRDPQHTDDHGAASLPLQRHPQHSRLLYHVSSAAAPLCHPHLGSVCKIMLCHPNSRLWRNFMPTVLELCVLHGLCRKFCCSAIPGGAVPIGSGQIRSTPSADVCCSRTGRLRATKRCLPAALRSSTRRKSPSTTLTSITRCAVSVAWQCVDSMLSLASRIVGRCRGVSHALPAWWSEFCSGGLQVNWYSREHRKGRFVRVETRKGQKVKRPRYRLFDFELSNISWCVGPVTVSVHSALEAMTNF